MSKHISIAIGSGDLHALWIQTGYVRWHAHAPLADPSALDQALRLLLSSAPAALRRARVTVVLSPRWVQVKRLHGLPDVPSWRIAAQLLRENEQAFFLWNGKPSAVVVQPGRDGAPWAAAYESEFLLAIVRAIRAERMYLAEVVPSVAAVGAIFPNQRVAMEDGEQRFEIHGTAHELLELRRVPDHEFIEPLASPDALRAIGPDADRCLPAYAGSILSRRPPLAWRPGMDPAQRQRRARLAHAAGCAALILAAAVTTLAPAARAALIARDQDRELEQLRGVQAELSSTQSDLRRVSGSLDRVAKFTAERGRVTRALGALSRAIPESTAILDFRLDSVEGSFTVLAPDVAAIVPALSEIREITEPRIVGSITREMISGVRLERAAVRFRGSRPMVRSAR